MVVVRVDLRHISDEKKLSYSDVLWQYVKQDFLWRINNAGLGKVLWLQKPYFATGEKLAFYYVYGSPGGRAEDNGTPFDVLRNIIIGNAGLTVTVMWYGLMQNYLRRRQRYQIMNRTAVICSR